LYCTTAEQVLGLDHVDEKSVERQLGKTSELGLGYQMGAGRLLTTIRKARIPTENITETDTASWVGTAQGQSQGGRVLGHAGRRGDDRGAQSGTLVPRRLLSFLMRDGVLTLAAVRQELSYPAPCIEPGRFGRSQVAFLDMRRPPARGGRCTAAPGLRTWLPL
jgi:hypothetical protein